MFVSWGWTALGLHHSSQEGDPDPACYWCLLSDVFLGAQADITVLPSGLLRPSPEVSLKKSNVFLSSPHHSI